jgi:hypothetical protein
MRKSLSVFLLLLAIVFGYTGMAIADYTWWFNVGVRTYEDGTYLNRIDLEIYDNGENVSGDIVDLDSVELKDPNGDIIELDDLTFVVTPYMGWGSNYDGWSGLWTFEGYFENPYGSYKATLPDDLIEGDYTINFDINGISYTETKYYTGTINLPIVRGSSIKQRYDKNGNLLITWEGIYGGFPYLEDPDMNTSIRVCIFSDQSFWQLTVPAHMSTAFIPYDIIEEI